MTRVHAAYRADKPLAVIQICRGALAVLLLVLLDYEGFVLVQRARVKVVA